MKLKQTIIGIVILLGVGFGIFALVKFRSPAAGDGAADDENTPTVISVEVGALKRMTLHQYVNGYGMVEAAPATATEPAAGGVLAASTAGTVAKVNVIAAQQVQKGDVLMVLDSASASFNYAKAEVERQETLFAQQNTSLKNLEDARAQLAALQVIAPVSGTVTRLDVKPGQPVDAGAAVAEVIDLNRLAISAKIPAAQAGALQAGQDVQILTDPPVTTSLSFVSPTVDSNDGTVLVWASLPAQNGLKPGLLAQLKIVTGTHTNCLAAPAESVVADDSGNNFISLVDGDEATQTPVQAGFREDDWVEVTASGLKEGGQVVTVGAYGLPDKTQIKIANPSDETSDSPGAQ